MKKVFVCGCVLLSTQLCERLLHFQSEGIIAEPHLFKEGSGHGFTVTWI